MICSAQLKESDVLEKITIYADGGCRGNGSTINIGGYGAILSYKGHTKEIYGGEKNTTNNQMELKACIEGLRAITNKTYPTELYMDSQYVISGMNSWVNGWIKKKWKGVKNVELWKELYSLAQEFTDLTFLKVEGHCGVDGNERADALANKAMDIEERK